MIRKPATVLLAPVTKLVAIAAVAISALVGPSAAQAYSIHNFRIRDAGPEIVAKVTVCTYPPRGYENKFYFRVHVETEDGAYGRNVDFYGWYGRGCSRGSNVFRDALRYEGSYFGRVKVRLARTDWIRYTGWRTFYVR